MPDRLRSRGPGFATVACLRNGKHRWERRISFTPKGSKFWCWRCGDWAENLRADPRPKAAA